MVDTVRLPSVRNLARNALWNFAGMVAPLPVGVLTFPPLIEGMGKDRFGLLAVIWTGVGYFSVFDLGLGRALTKLVAERLGRREEGPLDEIIWTALCLIGVLGLVGTMTLLFLAKPLVAGVFDVSTDFANEGVLSVRLLAIGIPIVTGTSALIGILEAHQCFAKIALVRIPLGIATFAGPLISLQITPSLVGATAVLLAARLLAFLVYFVFAASVCTPLRQKPRIARVHLRPLFNFGGWLTVTNLVGPLMTYCDRFFLGAFVGLTAVTYYVTPYEVLSRAQMLPQAIVGVLFPVLAGVISTDPTVLRALYGRTARVLLVTMLVLMGSVFLFAPELLQLWMGEEFRVASTSPVRWLALGWIVNSVAVLSFALLQSVGRPDLIAKSHLAEFVLYLLALWVLTNRYGIVGTAVAWFIRVLLDTLILSELACRVLPDLKSVIRRTQVVVLAFVIGAIPLWMADSLGVRVILLVLLVLVAAALLRPILTSLRYEQRTAGAEPLR